MGPDEIEAAYEPFVKELRAGGFGEAEDGWSAELIAAHVARNNELIAELAEQVAAGESPAYDNDPTVDDELLRTWASEIGGLEELATAVEESAARLAAARAALDDERGAQTVNVVIHSSGEVVHDGPIPIAGFVEGNASGHLEMHLEQLRALRA